MAEQVNNKEKGGKPFGALHIVLLCLAFGALAVLMVVLAVSNRNQKRQAVEDEQAFMDSLHVFPPIEFADSLYAKVTLKSYEDDAPQIEVYYVKDSLGNPTSEIAHETHYYQNHQKYIDGNRNGATREGLWYAYYPDGTVQTKGFYVNGKEQGRYTVYYSNGNVRFTGVYDHGNQVGEWRFFNEDGTLSHTETY